MDRDIMARAFADPTTSRGDLLVLEALSGWPYGHPLTLDTLAAKFTSLDRPTVIATVARLENAGWIPRDRIDRPPPRTPTIGTTSRRGRPPH